MSNESGESNESEELGGVLSAKCGISKVFKTRRISGVFGESRDALFWVVGLDRGKGGLLLCFC